MVWKLFSRFRHRLDKKKQQLYKEKLDFGKTLLVFVVGYGLVLNFALWQIFQLPFTWFSWIAWGFAFWFIREELPIIIQRILGRR